LQNSPRPLGPRRGPPHHQNEESSGIIDVTDLVDCDDGHTCLLLDAQVHKSLPDIEIVEMGQLLLMQVPN
jgi:hypothetical protein